MPADILRPCCGLIGRNMVASIVSLDLLPRVTLGLSGCLQVHLQARDLWLMQLSIVEGRLKYIYLFNGLIALS